VLLQATVSVDVESSGTVAAIGSMLLPKLSVVPATVHELKTVAVTCNVVDAVADQEAPLTNAIELTTTAFNNLDIFYPCSLTG